MIEPAHGRTSRAARAAAQARRREIERCLAGVGLAGGPRGLAGSEQGDIPPHFDGSASRRLRHALERLGPVFASFGRYLGSRPDLLPLADCLELRQTAEPVEPLPEAAVHALIELETGRPFAEIFEAVDAVPLRCGLVTQTHGARLAGGWNTVLRLVRPDFRERLERDLPDLPLLAAALGREDRSFDVDVAISGFQQAVAARADLQAQAGALRALNAESVRLGSLRLPRIALSTPRLLCLELLEGADLGALQPSPSPPAELADLARRLWLAWLYHALRGKVFPVELDGRGLLVLADGSIGLQRSIFAGLPLESQQNLLGYLAASAAEDPDEACSRLVREMEPAPPPHDTAEMELRQRFRQSVAFRDGGWGSAWDGHSLAEQLFVQWRLAGRHGFRPPPHLVSFFRGLFDVAVAVRPLVPPDRDPLREALENLRLLAAFDQVGRMADPDRLRRSFESYGAALAELPTALDGALSQWAEGRPRLRVEVQDRREDRREGRERPRGVPALSVALFLAIAAVALMTVRLGSAPQAGPWVEAVGATVFTFLGGMLLWSFGRED
ncbi:MAG TPA: AarF/UbiB family protein [Thermoanaerobaculia bacterium]|nr:AarF/UbiB family protein [Thermoanaerobaculia bacterium]